LIQIVIIKRTILFLIKMIRIKKYLSEFIYLPIRNIYDKNINQFYIKSYSQEGEDLVTYRIFDGKRRVSISMLVLITLKDFQTPFFSIKEGGGV